MRTVRINDITIRECANSGLILSFKEKVEIAKLMDRVNYSVVSLPALSGARGDELLVKTIAATLKNSAVSLTVGFSKDDVKKAWDCVSMAKTPELCVAVPVSAVQMEYICGKKGPKVVEMIAELVREAAGFCKNVEFSACDATRAEEPFLAECIKTAINAGATKITLCDTAGIMLPDETAAFIKKIFDDVPGLTDVSVAVEMSSALDMSTACAFAAATAGVNEIKTTISGDGFPQVENVVRLIDKKGENFGIDTDIVRTEISRAVRSMERLSGRGETSTAGAKAVEERDDSATFSAGDDINVICDACRKIGYDLSEEDAANVYEAFMRVATKKNITLKELEVIVANSALQVPATYKLVSYVTNSGNIIQATANIKLQRGDEELNGVSVGDGPIDASFKAIEQILGHHYELDDFQIQSVTEGREALGQAIVKLRANGTLYSGSGISTDIIGASVRAYISAINKIVYTEE